MKGEYIPQKAQQKFWNRWQWRKPHMKKIRKNNELEEYIQEKLQEGWSPEQIAGRWNKFNKYQISFMSIYNYLDSQFGWKFKKCLWYKGKKRKRGKAKTKKVLIPDRVWIDARPEIVNQRRRFGDYEGDTIVSKRGDTTSLLSILEKLSRYLFIKKIPNRKPDQTQEKITEITKNALVRTMTFDNGVEFAHHNKLSCDTYFCHPYSSWEKGQVEYANRLVRRTFPKKTLMKNITAEKLRISIDKINNTPRKCLNWNTPKEVFLALSKNPP